MKCGKKNGSGEYKKLGASYNSPYSPAPMPNHSASAFRYSRSILPQFLVKRVPSRSTVKMCRVLLKALNIKNLRVLHSTLCGALQINNFL